MGDSQDHSKLSWTTWAGIIALILFVAIYAVKLFQHGGPPVTIKWIRLHQYTGIFFTLGWILHWPSVITLLLWPLLVAAYIWLTKKEEQFVEAKFGDEYRQYARKTPRFLPFKIHD